MVDENISDMTNTRPSDTPPPQKDGPPVLIMSIVVIFTAAVVGGGVYLWQSAVVQEKENELIQLMADMEGVSDRLELQIKTLEEGCGKLRDEKNRLAAQLGSIKNEVQTGEASVGLLRDENDKLTAEVETTTAAVKALEAEKSGLQKMVGNLQERLKIAEETIEVPSTAEILGESEQASDTIE